MKAIASIILSTLFALPAFAQDKAAPAPTPAPAPAAATPAAAAPAAAPAAVNVPKHTCAKPTPLTKTSNNEQITQFNKEIAVYRSCLEVYAVDMRRIADAHVSAANTTVDEYNAFVAAMRDVKK
jgi:hypothetical protein